MLPPLSLLLLGLLAAQPEPECNGCAVARCSRRFVDASCWWNEAVADGNASHALAAALATHAELISVPAMARPWLVAPLPGVTFASPHCASGHATVLCFDARSSGMTLRLEPGVLQG